MLSHFGYVQLYVTHGLQPARLFCGLKDANHFMDGVGRAQYHLLKFLSFSRFTFGGDKYSLVSF